MKKNPVHYQRVVGVKIYAVQYIHYYTKSYTPIPSTGITDKLCDMMAGFDKISAPPSSQVTQFIKIVMILNSEFSSSSLVANQG